MQLRLWNLIICIEKSRSEMLIDGDDISNDVVTLGFWFRVFFNVFLHSRSFPLPPDWRKSDSSGEGGREGTTGEFEVKFKLQRRRCKLFLLPPHRQSAPESLLTHRLSWSLNGKKNTWPISSHLVNLTVGQ